MFRGSLRTSFHRQRPPGAKGKRGKAKHGVIAGIQLDHDPGCTDDDDDIDFGQYDHRATTSFHGNDAFGYHGRTIDDDALEYFGNSNLRIVARNRGISDGFLPPEAQGQKTPTARSTETTQPNTQLTTQTTTQPVSTGRQVSAQSTSDQTSQKSDSSTDDDKSTTKSTGEDVHNYNTYPIRDRPPQVDVINTVAANVPHAQTYANAPVATKTTNRKSIPTSFLAGTENEAFDLGGSDENEQYVDEEYVLRMRRTSQRLSRERESKKKRQAAKAAKRAEKAQVQPWNSQDERYKNAASLNQNRARQEDNGQSNRTAHDQDTRPKQRATVYEPNHENPLTAYTGYNQSQPAGDRVSRDQPKTNPEIMIQYPPEAKSYGAPQSYNPDRDGGSVHNVKPSEVKKKLNHMDPLQFWNPPPPPPLEDDDAFNYPPVSMLASSPARNYGRPSAAVQPYSYSPQRSSPIQAPSPAQAFSYILGDTPKPSEQSSGYSGQGQGQGQNQGHSQSNGYSQGQGQGQGQGQNQGQLPRYEAPYHNSNYQKYDNTKYDNTKPGYGGQTSTEGQQAMQNPVKPFSYLPPQSSGVRERGGSRGGSGSYPRTDYIRQADPADNPGYLNAAYF